MKTLSALMVTMLLAASGAADNPLACDVTIPNGIAPPPGLGPAESFHGNGSLWTSLWTNGTVVFRPGGPGFLLEDGSLKMKWPWVRVVDGELTIQGRRTDKVAPPLRAEIKTARRPKGFHPTYLIFPTEGCWEVTARAGDASLTITTRVINDYP